ncbi:hypothetical protein EJB05_41338, partial [Eragrostis curvula]
RDSLDAGYSLSIEHSTDALHSPDGTFSCGFYNISPNASTFSIWFSKSSERTVVWSANHLHPVYTWGSRIKLDTDGNMVLKDYNGQIVWTNNVSVSDAMHVQAQLLDTGNLIVKGKSGTILWQSFDSPTDTLLPTQSITATTKLVSTNRLLDPGHYSFHFDDQYLLSLFYYQKDISFIYWPNPNRNIWEKLRMPFNSTTGGALDSRGHFLGSDNATFTAADWGPGIMRKLTLDYDGNLRLYSLNKANGMWSVTWMSFPQLCKVSGLCGRNGICVYTPVPACACAPGFEVIDPSDRSKGCKRTINISCDAQKVRFAKLPNTDFFGNDMNVHRFVSLDYCKNICLNDCKCKGFAYWEGIGDCYPKAVLHGGVTISNLGSTGTMYIKIHKGAKVPGSLVPQSQPFEMVLGRVVRMLKEKLQLDDTEESWIKDFIDSRLNEQYNKLQAKTMMQLAVSCLEEDRARRPTMEDVVQMLVSVDEDQQASLQALDKSKWRLKTPFPFPVSPGDGVTEMNSPPRSPASPPVLPMTRSQAEAATATATASDRDERRRKAKENLDVGAGSTVFGFAALLGRFCLPNKGHQGGNGNARLTTALLLLSFATFLTGMALMLLSLTMMGRPDLASAAHHAAAKCLVAACAGFSVLTLLSFLALVPGEAAYMYVGLAVVSVAVALAAGVHRYLNRRAGGGGDQQAEAGWNGDQDDDAHKEELDAASKITSAVTTSAFAGLIGVLPNAPKISGAAAAEAADAAIFFLFATATVGVFVLTVSKKVPEITNPQFRRLLVTAIRLANAFLLCSLACAASAAAFVVLRFLVFATFAPLVITSAICFLLRHCIAGAEADNARENRERLKAMEELASKVTTATFAAIMGVLGAFIDEKDERNATTMGVVMLVLASAFVSGFGFMVLAAAPSSARALLAPVAKVLEWSSASLFLATAVAVYGVVVGTL